MAVSQVSRALQQFVDDELLRAPLLFDQIVEAAAEHAQNAIGGMTPLQRTAIADLMQALQTQRARMSEYFTRSLREQVKAEFAKPAPKPGFKAPPKETLSLVDEDTVAVDVELSHLVEAIKSVAEYELRELQTYTSALVGDMDMARDHNPFRAESFARALWAAAQSLPLSRGHQVAFMRHASTPMAQLLRRSYAAASSRLESMGVEPAAYRTLILPSGSRRGGRFHETTLSPDLHRMRETMPAHTDTPMQSSLSLEAPVAHAGHAAGSAPGAPRVMWVEVARGTSNHVDRQAVELVSRLFEAMVADERVPQDVSTVISRLHGPALRLTLHDTGLLDQDKHPLWRFINRLVFEAEMTPDPADPERQLLLKMAQGTVEQIASEREQNAGLYRWALDRLEAFLQKRLSRRLAASATQIGALQKLEDKLVAGHVQPSSLHGMLDVPQLDTVPAELMDASAPAAQPSAGADEWIDTLRPGDWVRVFLQGEWTHARLLWPGERREVWLFGDGGSDDTWAIRRGALLTLHGARLAKTLKQRSIVGSAAARVQEQMAAATAA